MLNIRAGLHLGGQGKVFASARVNIVPCNLWHVRSTVFHYSPMFNLPSPMICVKANFT